MGQGAAIRHDDRICPLAGVQSLCLQSRLLCLCSERMQQTRAAGMWRALATDRVQTSNRQGSKSPRRDHTLAFSQAGNQPSAPIMRSHMLNQPCAMPSSRPSVNSIACPVTNCEQHACSHYFRWAVPANPEMLHAAGQAGLAKQRTDNIHSSAVSPACPTCMRHCCI